MTESDRGEPLVLVLFGARGDLARRMLFPSLYRLAAKGRLPDKFAIIGSGPSDKQHVSNDVHKLSSPNEFIHVLRNLQSSRKPLYNAEHSAFNTKEHDSTELQRRADAYSSKKRFQN